MISMDTIYKEFKIEFRAVHAEIDETHKCLKDVEKKLDKHLTEVKTEERLEVKQEEKREKIFDKKTTLIVISLGVIGLIATFK